MEKFVTGLEGSAVTEEEQENVPMLMSITASRELTRFVGTDDEFSVVYAVDTRFEKSSNEWQEISESIIKSAEVIFNRSPMAKIYLLIQGEPGENGCEVVTNAVGENEFTNYEDFKYAVENKLIRNMNTSCLLSDSIKYVNEKIYNTNPVFVFSFFDQNNVFYREADGYEVLNNLNRSIDISLVSKITEDRRKGYAMDLLGGTGAGILFSDFACKDEILNHIYGAVPEVDSSYPIISVDGLYRVKLDEPITYKYIQAANGEITDFTGFADTDRDGLYDFREIDCLSDLIEVDYNKNVKLPTFGQCIKAKGKELFYVDSGLERFKKYVENNEPGSPAHRIDILINQTQVLPIISDPTSENGDGDNLNDIIDREPLLNIFPKYSEAELIMIDRTVGYMIEAMNRYKKENYRDEVIQEQVAIGLETLEKIHNSICTGSYEFNEKNNIRIYLNRNYNSSPDELLLELSGLVPYLGELTTFIDMMSYKDGIDYSNLKDIIISAINEKDITKLLEHRTELKTFIEGLEIINTASNISGGIKVLKIILLWNSEESKIVRISIDIPLSTGIYKYDCLFNKENICKEYNNIMDSYAHYTIKGLELWG